jgi:RNA polymerase sigma-70 factor (ECF subfamily)
MLERAIIYCVIPRELASELHEPLRNFFRDNPSVEVIVEQRRGDRRRKGDRRRREAEPPGDEDRRQLRARAGRRLEQRRAALVAAPPPALPAVAEPFEDQISFVERIEPSTLEREDADTARLVARVQAGDSELFSKLYQRYFDRVYAYLRITLQDPYEAEDATQEVFMRVMEALPKYERRSSPFRGWLFRIVRNAAINRLRQSQRLTVEAPEELARRAELAQSQIGDTESWLDDRDLLDLVEQLPLGQRQVIVLRYMMGLRSGEIAQVLDRTPEAVRQLHQRAMRFLRERMDPPVPSASASAGGGSGRRRIPREPMTRLEQRSPVLRARRRRHT